MFAAEFEPAPANDRRRSTRAPVSFDASAGIGGLGLGASGAVSAVLFAFVLLSPWSLIFVFFLPMPAILYAVMYAEKKRRYFLCRQTG